MILAVHFVCWHLAFPVLLFGESNFCAAWDWFYYNIPSFSFWVSFFSHSCYDCSFQCFSLFFVFCFVFPQGSESFHKCCAICFVQQNSLHACTAFSFIQLSCPILLSSGNHSHPSGHCLMSQARILLSCVHAYILSTQSVRGIYYMFSKWLQRQFIKLIFSFSSFKSLHLLLLLSGHYICHFYLRFIICIYSIAFLCFMNLFTELWFRVSV